MSRRNVAFKKPADPAFIRRIKEQLGYKEGPNVNTKRQSLDYYSDDSEPEEESPQIVVVKAGDLSADQVAKLKKEEEESKADLSKRVIFKRPNKASAQESDPSEQGETSTDGKLADDDTAVVSGKAVVASRPPPGGKAAVSGNSTVGGKTPAVGKPAASKRPGAAPLHSGSVAKLAKPRPTPGALSFDVDEDEED